MVYVSTHGTDDTIEEVRIAAYPSRSGKESFFFSYVWEINAEFEDMEDVTHEIGRIAEVLKATVVQVDGLLPDDRCACCDKKTFRGPGSATDDSTPSAVAPTPRHLLN